MTSEASGPPRLARLLLTWTTPRRYRQARGGAEARAGRGTGSGRLLDSLLFEVSAVDPWTYLSVAAVLTTVALGATCFPALRATRVDPLTSIRNE